MFRFLTMVTMFVAVASVSAAQQDPKAINISLPKDIKWVTNPGAGAEQAILVVDPNKPGLRINLLSVSSPFFAEKFRVMPTVSYE